jgi:response regulator of citrate/malate metabolism
VAVLISDIRMEGMDGVALLEEVRRRFPDTAVIMLSAVDDVQIAVDCLKKGALDYIAKPMTLGEVQVRVAKALEKRELTLQNRYYQKHLTEVRRQRGSRAFSRARRSRTRGARTPTPAATQAGPQYAVRTRSPQVPGFSTTSARRRLTTSARSARESVRTSPARQPRTSPGTPSSGAGSGAAGADHR